MIYGQLPDILGTNWGQLGDKPNGQKVDRHALYMGVAVCLSAWRCLSVRVQECAR